MMNGPAPVCHDDGYYSPNTTPTRPPKSVTPPFVLGSGTDSRYFRKQPDRRQPGWNSTTGCIFVKKGYCTCSRRITNHAVRLRNAKCSPGAMSAGPPYTHFCRLLLAQNVCGRPRVEVVQLQHTERGVSALRVHVHLARERRQDGQVEGSA